ncbi:UNVERIFIED_CONTAM: hypothetical protein FKN15_020879 [Acipenser sinensis]
MMNLYRTTTGSTCWMGNSANRYHPCADSGAVKTNTADCFFHTADSPCSHLNATASEDNAALGSLQASPQAPGQTTGVAVARPAMQPPQSYSVRGPRSSGQLTGRPAGAQPVYMGRWCVVSRGHPGRPKPSPLGQCSANCAPPPGNSCPRSAVE